MPRPAGSARAPASAFLAQPLDPLDTSIVELDDLVRFVQHPVRAFLRQRLGVAVGDGDDEPAEGLPVQLDALERWTIGQRLLDARLAGIDWEACIAAERVRGGLPPGSLGEGELAELRPVVDQIVEAAASLVAPGDEATAIEVDVDLGGGRSLVGTVPGIVGDVLLSATYSKVAARHRLAAWVRLVAVTVAHPGRPFTAATVGRGKGRGAGVATIGPLDAAFGRSTTSGCWSTSTLGGCANHSRCTARRRRRTPAGATPGASGRPIVAGTTRTTSRSTASCSAVR